ncbi:hypothetical protein ACEPAG_6344 [Sanghuangporus baumii]
MPSPPNSNIDLSSHQLPSTNGSSAHHRPQSVSNERAIDSDNVNSKQVPPRPPLRSNFELEPNPFEQSFSVSSSSLSSLRHAANHKQHSPPSSSENKSNSAESTRDHSPSRRQSMSNTSGHPNGDTPKPVLPPLASITSPSDPSYAWAFSSAGLTNSLRAGPLSPAMLAGPQTQHPTSTSQSATSIAALAASAGSMHPPLFGFDPSGSFRTGLTPSTGLTPLVGGPVSFPPPSPNTAAFLAMVNSGAGGAAAATITPNTLNALAGVLQQSAASASQSTNQQANGVSNGSDGGNSSGNHNANGSSSSTTQSQAVAPTSVAPSQVAAPAPSTYQNGTLNSQNQNQTRSNNSNNGYPDAAGAANHAANGLFLLSQAHQELTKREEAQKQSMAQAGGGSAAKGSSAQNQASTNANGTSSAKRGSKRKAETASVTSNTSAKAETSKKSKALSTSSRGSTARRGSTVSNQDMEDDLGEEDEESGDEQQKTSQSTNHRQNKKPETEEEKRRNFLERNRQAALKCRQRKKQWLAQLQAKNEYLQNENERLTAALVASREEISRLSQLVGGAGVGLSSGVVPMVGVASMGAQQQQVHHTPFMAHQQQHHPIAVPVSLPQGSSSMSATAASPPIATKASPHLQQHHAQQQLQQSPNMHSPTSDGRSSRSSFRDVRDYANGTSSVSGVRENATRDYARDMREREMGHVHGRAPQAVAVNGRTYGY